MFILILYSIHTNYISCYFLGILLSLITDVLVMPVSLISGFFTFLVEVSIRPFLHTTDVKEQKNNFPCQQRNTWLQ